MAYSEIWRWVDALTLSEISHLWVGLEPPRPMTTTTAHHPDLYAIHRMLEEAVLSRDLEHEPVPNVMAVQSSPREYRIRREKLTTWCVKRKFYPDFLFNTLSNSSEHPFAEHDAAGTITCGPLPDGENEPHEQGTRPAHIFQESPLPSTARVFPPSVVVHDDKRKRGRPAEYDKDAIVALTCRLAERDGLPKKQEVLINQILTFLAETDQHPDHSVIRKWVSRLYKHLHGQGWTPPQY